MTETLNEQARTLVDVVLETLAIPHAATVGHDETRQDILNDRMRHLLVFLEGLRDPHPADLEWSLGYLRERLAEHPPVGYVTHAQAQERIEAGASWAEAVGRASAVAGGRSPLSGPP